MFPETLIFVLVFSQIFAVTLDSRIVNGTDTRPNEFPHVVSLRTYYEHTCGGTILNERFILTAAHCVPCGKKPDGMSIQYGSYKVSATAERSVNVKKIYCNNYNAQKMIFDVAILELAWPIPPGNWKPVKIAKNYDGRYGQTGVIVGWGRLSTNGPAAKTLQKAMVNVYSDNSCARTNHQLQHHICVGAPYVGACFGDSGTALFVNDTQVGIASYISDEECGVSNEMRPNVYSRVATYYPWIAKVAGLLESSYEVPDSATGFQNPNQGVYNPYWPGNLNNIPPTTNPYNNILYNPYPGSYNYYPATGSNSIHPAPGNPINSFYNPNGVSYNPYFNTGSYNNPLFPAVQNSQFGGVSPYNFPR